jgi:hypothetical protein
MSKLNEKFKDIDFVKEEETGRLNEMTKAEKTTHY